jgi:hypothetical protein
MRPYLADNDCDAIAVELVSAGCKGAKGEDSSPSWGWVRVWPGLIDIRNEGSGKRQYWCDAHKEKKTYSSCVKHVQILRRNCPHQSTSTVCPYDE